MAERVERDRRADITLEKLNILKTRLPATMAIKTDVLFKEHEDEDQEA